MLAHNIIKKLKLCYADISPDNPLMLCDHYNQPQDGGQKHKQEGTKFI